MEAVPEDRRGETKRAELRSPAPRSGLSRWGARLVVLFWSLLGFSAACRDAQPDSGPSVAPVVSAERTPAGPAPVTRASAAPATPEASRIAVEAVVAPAVNPVCLEGMVLVEGNYCTQVEHDCARWLDDPKLPYARCAEYSSARCVGTRRPMRYCIDAREYTPPGETLPLNYASYHIANHICKSLGKRLCTESEWTFACEGETMRPYAHGFSREPVCNYDRSDLYEMKKGKQVLRDLRVPSGSMPECVSPFGVFDMAGNLDEPTVRERGASANFHNALKGGWWMAARNRCRPATTAHDDYYKDIQIGVRCCADAKQLDPGPKG